MKKKRAREEGLGLARVYRSSRLTLRKFCKRNGVTECSVQYWMRKAKDDAMSTSLVAEATFVEVKPKVVSLKKGAAKVKVGVAEVSLLLDGIDFSKVRRSKKWLPPHRESILSCNSADRADLGSTTVRKYDQ